MFRTLLLLLKMLFTTRYGHFALAAMAYELGSHYTLRQLGWPFWSSFESGVLLGIALFAVLSVVEEKGWKRRRTRRKKRQLGTVQLVR